MAEKSSGSEKTVSWALLRSMSGCSQGRRKHSQVVVYRKGYFQIVQNVGFADLYAV